MRLRLRGVCTAAAALAFVPWAIAAFSCEVSESGISYDLRPLGGLRTAVRESDTPPSKSEARADLDLCGNGLPREDGISDQDQCPDGTKVCLRMVNKKPPDGDRVISVIPVWTGDLADSAISTTPIGSKGQDGLRIYVEGPEYAGTEQKLVLTLRCATDGSDPNPTFESYTNGALSLEWYTPDACPRDSDGGSGGGGSSSSGSGGVGFWGFIRFLFWLAITGLILYFAIGIFYNHQQYSAKGWDLLPHRDFWREFPGLVSDLFAHLFANARGGSGGGAGGGGRSGYSSLG